MSRYHKTAFQLIPHDEPGRGEKKGERNEDLCLEGTTGKNIAFWPIFKRTVPAVVHERVRTVNRKRVRFCRRGILYDTRRRKTVGGQKRKRSRHKEVYVQLFCSVFGKSFK